MAPCKTGYFGHVSLYGPVQVHPFTEHVLREYLPLEQMLF